MTIAGFSYLMLNYCSFVLSCKFFVNIGSQTKFDWNLSKESNVLTFNTFRLWENISSTGVPDDEYLCRMVVSGVKIAPSPVVRTKVVLLQTFPKLSNQMYILWWQIRTSPAYLLLLLVVVGLELSWRTIIPIVKKLRFLVMICCRNYARVLM